jgi:hypothetical protein
MATGDAPATWYVRARGRVLGPLTRPQLQSLRDRGQLARFDQVSQDRQTWIGADRLDGLFPHSGGEGSLVSTTASAGIADFIMLDDDDAGPGPVRNADAPEWFFARGGAHQGPVSLSELQGMADRGEIEPETLVWRGGMEQWTPGSWVAELRFAGPLPASQGNAGANMTPAPGVVLPPRQGNPAAGQPILATRTSVLAISSLVMGLFWMFGLGSLAAIVLGTMSLRQIGRSNGTLTGKRLAIAGMIAGIIGLVISVLAFLFAARSSGGS